MRIKSTAGNIIKQTCAGYIETLVRHQVSDVEAGLGKHQLPRLSRHFLQDLEKIP
jgi:hypothetical protein